MKRLIKFFVLTALLCLSAACSQTFENMNTATTQKAQGRLVMSVGSTSRTLTPAITASSIKSAVLNANGKEIKTWDNTEKSDDFITKIENDSDILLDVGTYEFEMVFYTQHDEILQIGKCNYEITAGANYITFNMEIAYFGNGNNFSIVLISINWDKNFKVDKVKAGLYDIETREVVNYTNKSGKNVTAESTELFYKNVTNMTYLETGVPAGQYLFKCELYYGENLLNTVIEVIKIIDGIGTADAIHINKLNGFYTVTYQTDGTWNDGFVPTTIRSKITGVTLPTADQITNGDCEFQGWYDDDGNKITEIPAGTIKDFVFTSKWKMTCTTDTLIERLKNTKVGIYDIIVTGTMTEDIITSINDSLLDEVYEYPDYVIKKREKLKINLDLSQTTGMTSIPDRTFLECCNFVNITLSDDVTSIGADAFFDCENLESITLPAGVTTIENSAFSGCDKLTDVYISDLDAWYNIEFSNNYSNPLYCNGNLYLNGNLVTELVIPDSVTSISHFAFNGCNSITSVVIPVSMTFIEDNVFYGCKNLASVTFENTENWWIETNGIREADLTNPAQNADFLKNNAYRNLHVSTYTGAIIATADNVVSKLSNLAANSSCTVKLTGSITADTISSIAPLLQDETKKVHLDLSETTGLTSIAADAFYNCRGLVSIKLPNSITDIGAHAFEDCQNLANIDIQDGVKTIGHAAFAYCSSLTELIMPDSVTSLGKDLQESLCKHYFCDACNKNRADPDHDYDCSANPYDKGDQWVVCSGDYLSLFRGCSNLMTVEFSKNLTYMHGSDYLFGYCPNLTNVTLPDCLTYIGISAFADCKKLTSLIIPDGVTYIAYDAFIGCSALKNLTIPNSVTSISYRRTFDDCNSLVYNEHEGLGYLGNEDNPYLLLAKIKDRTITSLVPHQKTRFIYGTNVMSNSNLTSLTITENIESFGHELNLESNPGRIGDAICCAIKLENIYVSDKNPLYSSKDGILYNKDQTVLLSIPYKNSITNLTIPKKVTHIHRHALPKYHPDPYSECNLQSLTFEDPENWYMTYTHDNPYKDENKLYKADMIFSFLGYYNRYCYIKKQ